MFLADPTPYVKPVDRKYDDVYGHPVDIAIEYQVAYNRARIIRQDSVSYELQCDALDIDFVAAMNSSVIGKKNIVVDHTNNVITVFDFRNKT